MNTQNVLAASATIDDLRWQRVLARDASGDGEFFYSVSSSGVYCRPSCASRRAKPAHVAFHASVAAAERAGFRPCKRCRPDRPSPPAAVEELRYAIAQGSLGTILVARSERGVCAILLGDDEATVLRELHQRFPPAALRADAAAAQSAAAQAAALIEAPASAPFDLPLDARGTAFQRRVWQALREVRPGTTVSYTQIAARIGAPKALRAVAQACGANPIAVAIPCHRVVRSDGALSGYRWGVQRKRALLQREAAPA